MTFDIWHLTFDIWHLTWLKATALILMILAQSYYIFTDGFWGYLSNLKSLVSQSVSQSLSHNMDLRDASASKNFPEVMVVLTYWEASGEFSELRYKILLYFSSKRSYCRCTSLIWFTSFTCFTCRCVPTSQDVLIFIVLSPDLELLPGEIWPQQVHLIITLSIDSSKMIHLNG